MTEAAKEYRRQYMKNRYATAEAREKRNAYYREWRAKNRDKVSIINARYWEKKAAEAVANRGE